ncbi:MAG: FtsW/RodA/SpoVE family cell cycle protein [Clostridiales bacterium]|nr:FtsW/RodA/SpoVE family cell cycle protein [Clostridiales bacterium]
MAKKGMRTNRNNGEDRAKVTRIGNPKPAMPRPSVDDYSNVELDTGDTGPVDNSKIPDELKKSAPEVHYEKPKLKLRDPNWSSNIPLILFLFFIVAYGLVVLYSVSAPAGYINSKLTSSAFFVFQQLRFTILGLVICIVVNFIPIDLFKNRIIMIGAYVGSTLLVVITTLFGVEKQGARRWLTIAGTDVQTSEVFKICLVIVLAIYRVITIELQKKGKLRAKDPKHQALVDALFEFFIPVMMILLVDIVILTQPHLSCFLIIGAVTVVCFLVSGIRLRSWVIGMGMLAVLALVGVLVIAVIPGARNKAKDKIESNFAHVFKRVDIYTQDKDEEMTDQEKDESLQVNRAKDAIGSGGVMGQGLGNSRYKYSYVSEAHNDYIFSIYVEETGMVGGTILIIIFLVFLYMGFKVALRAKDVFCRIIAIGYTFLIALEAMWNIGVELAVLPSTGITLPFFSYGGTAQLLLLCAYAMILCVARSGVAPKTKNGGKND